MSLFGSISNFISSLAPSDSNPVSQILGKDSAPSSSPSFSSTFLSTSLFSSKQQDHDRKSSLTWSHSSTNFPPITDDLPTTTTRHSKQQQQHGVEYSLRQSSTEISKQDSFQKQKKSFSSNALEEDSKRSQTFSGTYFTPVSSSSSRPSSSSSPPPSSSSSASSQPPPQYSSMSTLTSIMQPKLEVSTTTRLKNVEKSSQDAEEKVKIEMKNVSDVGDGQKYEEDRISAVNILSHELQTETAPAPNSSTASSSSSPSSSSSSSQPNLSSSIHSSTVASITGSDPTPFPLSDSHLQMTSSKPRDHHLPHHHHHHRPAPPPVIPPCQPPTMGDILPDMSFLSEEERRHIEAVMLRATEMQEDDYAEEEGSDDTREERLSKIEASAEDRGKSRHEIQFDSNEMRIENEEEITNRGKISEEKSFEKQESLEMQILVTSDDPESLKNESIIEESEKEIQSSHRSDDGEDDKVRVSGDDNVDHGGDGDDGGDDHGGDGDDGEDTVETDSEGPDTPVTDEEDTYELDERGFYTLHHLREENQYTMRSSGKIEEINIPTSSQTSPPTSRGKNFIKINIQECEEPSDEVMLRNDEEVICGGDDNDGGGGDNNDGVGGDDDDGGDDDITRGDDDDAGNRIDGAGNGRHISKQNDNDISEHYDRCSDYKECCSCCGRHQDGLRDTQRDTLRDTLRDTSRDTQRDTSRDTQRDASRNIQIDRSREECDDEDFHACTSCGLNVCLDCVAHFYDSNKDGAYTQEPICKLCHDEALQSESESDSESRSSDSVTITAIQPPMMEEETDDVMNDSTHDVMTTSTNDMLAYDGEKMASGDDLMASWRDSSELDAISDVLAANILSKVIDELGASLYEIDSLGNLQREGPVNLNPPIKDWSVEDDWVVGGPHQSPPSWCDWSTFDNPDVGIEPDDIERQDFWHIESRRSSTSSDKSSEYDQDEEVAQKVTIIHFNRSDSAPCKTYKNHISVEHQEYQRSQSVPRPHLASLTSSFFGDSSFSVLSEGIEIAEETSETILQENNDIKDSRDGIVIDNNKLYEAARVSESIPLEVCEPTEAIEEDNKTPTDVNLPHLPSDTSSEQSSHKQSPELDSLYNSLFDNSSNPLSRLFQTTKISPENACSEDPPRTVKIHVDERNHQISSSSQITNQPAVTFTNPSFKKDVSLHLSNLTQRGHASDKVPVSSSFQKDQQLTAIPICQTIISPSTFEKLLNEVKEEELEKEKSWTCNPLHLSDPSVENSRVYMIRKTQSKIERLNDYDFDSDEDPLESAFKGFSNQLASLTNDDSVDKKPISVRSLEDFTTYSDKNEDTATKMSKTYKFPLKSVKSVPAFVNPSFLFDRTAATSQSSDDIINEQEPICETEIPGKHFQKSHSVIFPHATSTIATPNFNWSSLNDLSVPLEKVLAELDQTLKPFVTSTDKLKSTSDGTSPGVGFMRRCPSYSNILTHPLLVDDETAKTKAVSESVVDSVEMQTSVDSSFAEVTATLQETTSELETLKFDLENKSSELISKSSVAGENIINDSTNALFIDDKGEVDIATLFSSNGHEIKIDENEIAKIATSQKSLKENPLIRHENRNPNSKDAASTDESVKATDLLCDDQNANASCSQAKIIEESAPEIRPNKSKSEIMRLLSMSRYRDMSPEPIYLEGLKSPCLVEPELDELHFLSDEELREIDLDEDIPPKHLFQFSKKSQAKSETNSKEDYFQYPGSDAILEVTNKKGFNYKYFSDGKTNETNEVSDKNEAQNSRRKLPPLPGLEKFSIEINKHFENHEKKFEPSLKSVKQTSKSLELRERTTTTNKNLSLDESKLSQFSSKRQEAKDIINEKVAFPEAMLERFLDLKNSLFGASEKLTDSSDKPYLQRRHSSMWRETKRKYNSIDENKFLQRSDSVNCKSASWSVRSFSLDLPDESDDENNQATKEANFWRHAKTIDQRPSHLFGFVPRNDEDSSDDAAKSELDKNYCKKLLLKNEDTSFASDSINVVQKEIAEKQMLTENTKINEPETCKVETKPRHATLSREDSDDKEMVDIFGLKISRSKHYLHQRVKDEIKIVTATKRLRIDEAEEIRMMEAEMAVREKMRKARAQESSKAIGKANSDNTLDISYLKTDYPSMESWNKMKQPSPASSFSQDLMNVLNDITELPLLSERKQSLLSSVSSITSSSQSVEAMENSNYIDVGQGDYDFYGYYDVPQRNPRSRSSTSCYSDSYAGGRTRKDTFESRSSQLIYPADDEDAIVESGVDFNTYTTRQSSYSLPGSRSTSMSRSVNSEINEESYYNNFDYYNKYDPDYDYFVRLQREEQMKQEKLNKLRMEIEKRRKHLQEIMPRPQMSDNWQASGQYQYPSRPYYNMEWMATDNYGNAMPYGVEECPGIIKPIDYQIKTQLTRHRMSDYREMPGDRYYGYHHNYGQYFAPQTHDHSEVQLKAEEQIVSNSRRTPVDLTEILGMTNEQIAREKLSSQISKSRSPAKSPSHTVIQEQNKKPYNGKVIHQQPRSYHKQIHHASMHGNGRKMDPLTADTSDSEESLQHCPVTCGSSRDSGVSSGEVAGEMFERSELFAIRSSSGDLLTIQTTPPPHYATGSRKRGGTSCRMGSNVLVDRRLIRHTNSVAALKNTSLVAPIADLVSKQGLDELSKKRYQNTATSTRPIRPDPSQERVTYQEQSDYSLGSYYMDEDATGKVEKQISTSASDKFKTMQARKYKFATKKILLTADLNEKKFRENGFGLNILGGQKVAWEGSERVTGALVVAIQPGSIADQLNKELQEGDEILEWNGECLRGKTAKEVREIIDDNTICEVELVIRCGSFNSIRADLDQRSTTMSTICTLDSNLSVPTGTDSFEGLDPDSKHGARSRFKESSSRESCSDVRSDPKFSPQSSSPQKKSTTRRKRSPGHQSPAPQTSLESFTNDILALKQGQHEFRKSNMGEIQLQLSYDDFDGTLNVHVIQARNLVPKIKIGYSDPLVKVFLLPYASSTENKRKTKCVPRTLHPEWHQTLMFMQIRREDLPEKTLEISVWDHDRFMPDQLLGEVLLDLSDISHLDNRPHWYALVENCDNRYGRRPRTSTASSSSESGGDTSSSGEADKKHMDERRDKKKSNQKDSSANNSVSSGAKKRSHKSRRADSFGEGNMESFGNQLLEMDVLRRESDSKRKVSEEKEVMEGWSQEKVENESAHSQARTKDTHITWTDKRDSRVSTIVCEKKSQGRKCDNQQFVGYVRRTINVVWSSMACCSRSDSVLKRKQYSNYRNEPQDNEVLV